MNMIFAMIIADKFKSGKVDNPTERIVYDEILTEKPKIISELNITSKIHGITYKCAGYKIQVGYRKSIVGYYTATITNQDKHMCDMDITNRKLAKKLYQHARYY